MLHEIMQLPLSKEQSLLYCLVFFSRPPKVLLTHLKKRNHRPCIWRQTVILALQLAEMWVLLTCILTLMMRILRKPQKLQAVEHCWWHPFSSKSVFCKFLWFKCPGICPFIFKNNEEKWLSRGIACPSPKCFCWSTILNCIYLADVCVYHS